MKKFKFVKEEYRVAATAEGILAHYGSGYELDTFGMCSAKENTVFNGRSDRKRKLLFDSKIVFEYAEYNYTAMHVVIVRCTGISGTWFIDLPKNVFEKYFTVLPS